jgi:hypothetical protein
LSSDQAGYELRVCLAGNRFCRSLKILVKRVRPLLIHDFRHQQGEKSVIDVTKPLFRPGRVLATPEALEALEQAGQTVWELLAQHLQGQWGELSEEDRRLNDEAVKDGSRILSAYALKTGEKVWLITEATDDNGNRAATTILTPEEY